MVPPALAASVTVCVVLTAETAAWKLALVAPAAMVTEDGMVTEDELLDKLTIWPPAGAAAFRVTVQMSVAEPVSEALEQLTPPGIACPVPLKVIVDFVPVEELLVRVTDPLDVPAVVGLKPIVRVFV